MKIYLVPKDEIIIIGSHIGFSCMSNIRELEATIQNEPVIIAENKSDFSGKISFEADMEIGKTLNHLIAEGLAEKINFERKFEQKERGVIPPKFFKKSFR